MSDDLMERLRWAAEPTTPAGVLCRDSADRIAELESAVLREKRRVDSLHQCINERDAQLAEARRALINIYALEPHHSAASGMSSYALAGIAIRMGQIAYEALTGEE